MIDENEHRAHIVETLNDWYSRNRSSMGISDGTLKDNEDFSLAFTSTDSSVHVRLSCSCGVKVQLIQCGQHFSLANYYKHMKKAKCSMITKKKMKTNHGETLDSVENHHINSIAGHEMTNSSSEDDALNDDSSRFSPMSHPVASTASSIGIDKMIINTRKSKRSHHSQRQSPAKKKRP